MSDMTYRQLGGSGLTVSTVGIGCNDFGARMADNDVPRVVDAAIDAGITLFDTADVYGNRGGSETLLGGALGAGGSRSWSPPSSARTWGPTGRTGGPVVAALRPAGRRGQPAPARTDWIDLYQLHTPDPNTPIEETLAALAELVAEGKVRYIGSSNFAGWQVVDADWTARTAGPGPSSPRRTSTPGSSGRASRADPGAGALRPRPAAVLPAGPGLLTGKYRRDQDAPAGTRLASSPTGWRRPTST